MPDALVHWKEVFSRIFRRRTGLDESCHVATHLISARTGFGVEELVSDVWLKWRTKGGSRLGLSLNECHLSIAMLHRLLVQCFNLEQATSTCVDRATRVKVLSSTLSLNPISAYLPRWIIYHPPPSHHGQVGYKAEDT